MLNVATLKVVLVKCDLLRLVFGGLDWPYQFFQFVNNYARKFREIRSAAVPKKNLTANMQTSTTSA